MKNATDYESVQFTKLYIVIYPLPNGLFRIQIFRKNKVFISHNIFSYSFLKCETINFRCAILLISQIPFFGPLLDGMVVDKRILCPLVRQTAINASLRAKAHTLGSKKPYPARTAQLKEVIQRNKTEINLPEFYTNLYPISTESPKV